MSKITPKFTPPRSAQEAWQQRWRLLKRKFWVLRYLSFVAFMANTFGRIEHRSYHKKRKKGEKTLVDKVFAPPYKKELYEEFETTPADITPPKEVKLRKAKVMKRDSYPSTDYAFEFHELPLSGNVINGLGEAEPRRLVQAPFFSRGYSGPWNKMERLFQSINRTSLANFILNIFWMDRNRIGMVSRQQRVVENPQLMAEEIKSLGAELGAGAVGVTELQPEMCYKDFNLPFKYAISIALPMDREQMLLAPSHETGMEVQKTYYEVGKIAGALAQAIRQMGWPARASTNISPDTYEVLHIPVAVEAGIGTLGKHGSLIHREMGSNIRLATVLTDLPLAIDGPVDIGVDDFCKTCQICSSNCPPQAIFDVKKLVRGEEKWYVDFDRCVPYFVAHDACGICIEVCPWSEPGRGPLISQKMLSKKEKLKEAQS